MIDFFDALKANKKQAAILYVVAGMMAILVYFNFLLTPNYRWASRMMGQAGSAARELKDTEKEIGEIESLKKNLESNKETVAHYEKTLPAEHEIPVFLDGLSDIARSSDVKIVSIIPMALKEGAMPSNQIYQEFPILINARSGYHELGIFLSKLENSDRFMKVVDISIKSSAANLKKHNVELLILTYTLMQGRQA